MLSHGFEHDDNGLKWPLQTYYIGNQMDICKTHISSSSAKLKEQLFEDKVFNSESDPILPYST